MYLAYEALGLPQESQDALFVLSRIIRNMLLVIAVINVCPGVLYDEGETLAGILTFGFRSARDLADRLATFSESRRQDASRRPLATLRPAEGAPTIDKPSVVTDVFFRMTTDSLSGTSDRRPKPRAVTRGPTADCRLCTR